MNDREFRGKRKDNGEWVYGALVVWKKMCYIAYPDPGMSDDEIYTCGLRHAPVIPETVGQYTGIKDKHGNEIYEGDIVMYPDTYSEFIDVGVGVDLKVSESKEHSWGEVMMKDACFGLNCPKTGEILQGGFNSFSYIVNDYGLDYNELEVIGNIHENPELLEAIE
jgi:uncharacterized phage protein (TIGR01671 family)